VRFRFQLGLQGRVCYSSRWWSSWKVGFRRWACQVLVFDSRWTSWLDFHYSAAPFSNCCCDAAVAFAAAAAFDAAVAADERIFNGGGGACCGGGMIFSLVRRDCWW
jgi:hypothetical protein